MPNYVHSKCLKHKSKNMYCTPYKDLFTGINCSRNIISLPHYHYSSLLSSTVILFSNFSHACPYAICICISIISVAELQHYLPIYYILYLLLVLRIYFLLSAFSILLYLYLYNIRRCEFSASECAGGRGSHASGRQ